MQVETLAQKQVGPLALDVRGTRTLCITDEGDANLVPFTATVYVKNTSAEDVAIIHMFVPFRSFNATQVDGVTLPVSPALSRNDFLGDPNEYGPQEKILRPDDVLLISSATRHHDHVWQSVMRQAQTEADTDAQDFSVEFSLSLTYDDGAGDVLVSEDFDITFSAVPQDF